MRYIFCVLFPPVAVLSTGRFLQSIFSFLLTLLFWIPGMIHAFFVVNDYNSKRRLDQAFHRAGNFHG